MRLILILICVSAVVIATAQPKESRKNHSQARKTKSVSAKSDRATTRSNIRTTPRTTNRSAQKSYTRTTPTAPQREHAGTHNRTGWGSYQFGGEKLDSPSTPTTRTTERNRTHNQTDGGKYHFGGQKPYSPSTPPTRTTDRSRIGNTTGWGNSQFPENKKWRENRQEADRQKPPNSSGDWNRDGNHPSNWNRDRDSRDKNNSRDAERTYRPNVPDNRERDGNRNRDGDRKFDGNPDRSRENKRHTADRPHPPNIPDHRDRDWDRDRRGDHNRGPDKAYRYDSRGDRRFHRDDWWTHHRYAQKTYSPKLPPMPGRSSYWRIEWSKPYRGSYYDIWRYVPSVIVTTRPELPPPLLGSAIIASDDTFLGLISRDWQDPDSISNPYERFGCPESPYSIWHTEGRWGNTYSPDSPWNPYATRPPRVYSGNYFLGYLTTNDDLYPRIDPYWLMDYLDIWVWD